jgi:hypothetical protein
MKKKDLFAICVSGGFLLMPMIVNAEESQSVTDDQSESKETYIDNQSGSELTDTEYFIEENEPSSDPSQASDSDPNDSNDNKNDDIDDSEEDPLTSESGNKGTDEVEETNYPDQAGSIIVEDPVENGTDPGPGYEEVTDIKAGYLYVAGKEFSFDEDYQSDDASITWQASTNTLILDSVTIPASNSGTPAIYFEFDTDLKGINVQLVGDNVIGSVADPVSSAIFYKSEEIRLYGTENSSLTIYGNDLDDSNYDGIIDVIGNLKIENLKLNIFGGSQEIHSLYVTGTLNLDNVILNITGDSYASIYTYDSINVTDSDIVLISEHEPVQIDGNNSTLTNNPILRTSRNLELTNSSITVQENGSNLIDYTYEIEQDGSSYLLSYSNFGDAIQVGENMTVTDSQIMMDSNAGYIRVTDNLFIYGADSKLDLGSNDPVVVTYNFEIFDGEINITNMESDESINMYSTIFSVQYDFKIHGGKLNFETKQYEQAVRAESFYMDGGELTLTGIESTMISCTNFYFSRGILNAKVYSAKTRSSTGYLVGSDEYGVSALKASEHMEIHGDETYLTVNTTCGPALSVGSYYSSTQPQMFLNSPNISLNEDVDSSYTVVELSTVQTSNGDPIFEPEPAILFGESFMSDKIKTISTEWKTQQQGEWTHSYIYVGLGSVDNEDIVESLNEGVHSLHSEVSPSFFDPLPDYVEQYYELNYDLYTPESLSPLTELIEQVYSDGKYLIHTYEIYDYYYQISAAFDQLVYLDGDYSAINEIVNSISDLSIYTDDSLKKYDEAYQQINWNLKIDSQSMIDYWAANLLEAYQNLVIETGIEGLEEGYLYISGNLYSLDENFTAADSTIRWDKEANTLTLYSAVISSDSDIPVIYYENTAEDSEFTIKLIGENFIGNEQNPALSGIYIRTNILNIIGEENASLDIYSQVSSEPKYALGIKANGDLNISNLKLNITGGNRNVHSLYTKKQLSLNNTELKITGEWDASIYSQDFIAKNSSIVLSATHEYVTTDYFEQDLRRSSTFVTAENVDLINTSLHIQEIGVNKYRVFGEYDSGDGRGWGVDYTIYDTSIAINKNLSINNSQLLLDSCTGLAEVYGNLIMTGENSRIQIGDMDELIVYNSMEIFEGAIDSKNLEPDPDAADLGHAYLTSIYAMSEFIIHGGNLNFEAKQHVTPIATGTFYMDGGIINLDGLEAPMITCTNFYLLDGEINATVGATEENLAKGWRAAAIKASDYMEINGENVSLTVNTLYGPALAVESYFYSSTKPKLYLNAADISLNEKVESTFNVVEVYKNAAGKDAANAQEPEIQIGENYPSSNLKVITTGWQEDTSEGRTGDLNKRIGLGALDNDDVVDNLKLGIHSLSSMAGPADYSQINSLVEQYNALTTYLYTTDSLEALTQLIDEINYDYNEKHQNRVDAYAQAITSAFEQLVLKAADYSDIHEVMSSLPEDLSVYEQDGLDAYNAVLNSIDFNLTIDKQEEVDAKAEELAYAAEKLVIKKADYSNFNAVMDAFNALNKDLYVEENLTEFANYAAGIQTNLTILDQDKLDTDVNVLRSMLDSMLYKPADYSQINDLKERYNELNLQWYTDESLASLSALINGISYDHNITEQDLVDSYVSEIEASFNDLILKAADYSAMNEVISSLSEDLSVYEPEGLDAYQTLLNSVDWSLTIDKQDEVDAKATALADAVEKLTLKAADYTKLDSILASFSALDTTLYDEEGVLAFINYAFDIDRNLTVLDQNQVDEAVQTLSQLLDNLVYKKADYSKLNEVTAKVNDDLSIYDEDGLQAYTAILESVDWNQTIVQQNQVDEWTSQLEKAQAELTLKKADYSKLYAVMDSFNTLDKDEYSQEKLSEFTEYASGIQMDLTILEQDKLDADVDALQAVLESILFKPADYSQINVLKENYNGLNTQLYTEESLSALSALINNIDYDCRIEEQTLVDSYAREIKKAFEQLVLKPADYTKINNAVTAGKSVFREIYTEDSLKSLDQTLAVSIDEKNILEQDELDQAADEIFKAIENLELKHADTYFADEAFNEALESASEESIMIEVEEKELTNIVLSLDNLQKAVEENKNLIFASEGITAEFDITTLKAITSQIEHDSPYVLFSIEQVDPSTLNTSQSKALKNKNIVAVISAEIVANGKVIHNFSGGEVTIHVPFTPEKGNGKQYKIVFVSDNGALEKVDSYYENGYMIGTLKHFSNYVIVKDTETVVDVDENEKPTTNQTVTSNLSGTISMSASKKAETSAGVATSLSFGIKGYASALAGSMIAALGIFKKRKEDC